MSDTPRTDAELDGYRGPIGMVNASFARQLERELAAAKEILLESAATKLDHYAQGLYILCATDKAPEVKTARAAAKMVRDLKGLLK